MPFNGKNYMASLNLEYKIQYTSSAKWIPTFNQGESTQEAKLKHASTV